MMEIKQKERTTNEDINLSKIKIIKRDGRLVDFSNKKIYDALMKSERQINGSLDTLAY